jgi:hypothetical protein
MTKKLKDSLHATLHACYNGNNGAEAVKTLMRENKKELYDAHVWNEVACKIQTRLKKHNKHAGSNLHIGDIEYLYTAIVYINSNDEEAFNNIADKCLTGLK